ncbi:hypothetical protein BH24ACT22_BH24ACT22_12070 [soil metagenome]
MSDTMQTDPRTILPEVIPNELKARPQWVNWRLEKRGEEWTKVPYDPKTECRASSTNPLTWASFEEAFEALDASGYDGVGFVFCTGDPYVGIDLDGCRDPETGQLQAWAEKAVRNLDGYAEVSPSDTGVHVIVRGEVPRGSASRRGPVEVYDSKRFFTMTGRAL